MSKHKQIFSTWTKPNEQTDTYTVLIVCAKVKRQTRSIKFYFATHKILY